MIKKENKTKKEVLFLAPDAVRYQFKKSK